MTQFVGYVLRPNAVLDRDSDLVSADLVDQFHVSPEGCISGIDVFVTSKGLFYRYDCYAEFSPFGYERLADTLGM